MNLSIKELREAGIGFWEMCPGEYGWMKPGITAVVKDDPLGIENGIGGKTATISSTPYLAWFDDMQSEEWVVNFVGGGRGKEREVLLCWSLLKPVHKPSVLKFPDK